MKMQKTRLLTLITMMTQLAISSASSDKQVHWVVWERPPWVNIVELQEVIPEVTLHIQQQGVDNGHGWNLTVVSGELKYPPLLNVHPEVLNYKSVSFNWTGLTFNPPLCYNHNSCLPLTNLTDHFYGALQIGEQKGQSRLQGNFTAWAKISYQGWKGTITNQTNTTIQSDHCPYQTQWQMPFTSVQGVFPPLLKCDRTEVEIVQYYNLTFFSQHNDTLCHNNSFPHAPSKRNAACFIGGFALPCWRSFDQIPDRARGYSYSKIPLAMFGIQVHNYRVLVLNNTGNPIPHYMSGRYNLTACMSGDYAFLSGPKDSIIINHTSTHWNISCNNCNVSECVDQSHHDKTVLVVKRPSMALMTAKHEGAWYGTPADKTIDKLNQLIIHRQKRCISCIILGIVALLSAITAATTGGIALSQSVANVRTLQHDASYLHSLAANVTDALKIQNEVNQQFFNAINQVAKNVLLLNEEVKHLAIKAKLRCDYRYTAFCLLPVKVNNTLDPFEKISKDLQGLWMKGNVTEDMQKLEQIIKDMDEALKEDLSPEHIAEKWYEWLQSGRALWSPLGHLVVTMISFVIILIVVVLILPCILRFVVSNLLTLGRVILQQKALLTKRGNCSDGSASSSPSLHARS
ncbi:uncharacterized protein LOC123256488 [Gracilinanus agilis]|uniref:uncharacterized protein LOC123256488 n=1 Tax=Gracilinanus agilis TaxID=191870 RepID=UPI001CFF0F31|nr:uncharacterized protein LOC123256488 [Gracilinanus agilis]